MKLTKEDELKGLMRVFPQGVTVITTSHRRKLHGVTVSSFASVSLKPPLVLVSLSKETPSHLALTESEHFTVNLLASNQAQVSERFAGRSGSQSDKFEGIGYGIGSNGCPVLNGSSGFIECSKWGTYDGGDHTLILGEVTNAEAREELLPLIYYKRQYTTVLLPSLEESAHESLLGEW
ncbi:MAG: flavin reductase family protein [Thaumarchaeota archaeon]|nr:flavin reductase family protein [Nitrososphaerota archaeon]